jgi:hypothetical protein
VRVDALRLSSLEIVDGSRPVRRAISRTPSCWAFEQRYVLTLGKDR